MSNLKHRLDNRTPSQFKQDIERGTFKENALIEIFSSYTKLKIVPNSHGRDGKAIAGNFTSGADFKIIYDDGKEEFIEVASCGLTSKVTFVKTRLQAYIKNNYSILLFIGTNITKNTPIEEIRKILSKAPNLAYCLVKPKGIQKILDDKTLPRDNGFGGKYNDTVCISKERFCDFFTFTLLKELL